MRERVGVALAVVALASGVSSSAALADGQAAGFNAGARGISAPHGDARFFTLQHLHGTTVIRTTRDGQRITATRELKSYVGLPAASLDGTPTGLSGDGSTLVLGNASGPFAKTSQFWVLSDGLRLLKAIRLKGSFTLDAVSPDGETLYLIEYSPLRVGGQLAYDPTRYSVHAYDVQNNRLNPNPIVDPREPDEKMQGLPMTRAMSPSGVWAYTLYNGSGNGPFIHALNTASGKAYCVELAGLVDRGQIYSDRMAVSPDGGTLTVNGRHGPLAVVDTRTLEVTAPASDDSSGGFPWILLLVAGGVGLASALLIVRSPKRRPATT